MQLRPYQEQVIAEVEQHQKPLIVAPTGSGKTVMASAIIERNPNKFVLFFAHRRELVFQPRDTLAECGVNAGVILAGESMNRMARVQVASVQTLHSRCVRGNEDLSPADLVFVDEAHHVTAKSYQAILERYPAAKIVGMTATPCRRDGRGLGRVFSGLVEAPNIETLIKLGYLVKTRVFAPSTPDLKGVRTRLGDYVESDLAERVDKPKLVGDIVSHWHRLGEGRKTVVFATSVEDRRIWFLNEDRKAESPAQEARATSPLTAKLLECVKCHAVRTAGKPCPECNYLPRRPGSYHDVQDGELIQCAKDGSLLPNFYSEERKQEFFEGLRFIARSRGNKPGAAAVQRSFRPLAAPTLVVREAARS